MLSKDQALLRLRKARNSTALTYAAMALLNSDALATLSGKIALLKPDDSITFDPWDHERSGARMECPFDQVVSSRANEPDFFLEKLKDIWASNRRCTLIEVYGTAWHYAESNKLVTDIQSQPWYRFLRTIRNTVSHDWNIDIHKSDRPHLPIVWEGKVIDASMHGTEMKRDLVSPYVTQTLVEAVINWVHGTP